MRLAATQRSVAETEAGSGTRHGFRTIVRHAITGKPRESSAPQLEGEAAAQADRDALVAYVAELHNGQPTERNQWDAREDRSPRRRSSLSTELLSSHSGKKEKHHQRRRSSSTLLLQQCELGWGVPLPNAQTCFSASDDAPAVSGAVANSGDSPPRHRSRRHTSSHTAKTPIPR